VGGKNNTGTLKKTRKCGEKSGEGSFCRVRVQPCRHGRNSRGVDILQKRDSRVVMSKGKQGYMERRRTAVARDVLEARVTACSRWERRKTTEMTSMNCAEKDFRKLRGSPTRKKYQGGDNSSSKKNPQWLRIGGKRFANNKSDGKETETHSSNHGVGKIVSHARARIVMRSGEGEGGSISNYSGTKGDPDDFAGRRSKSEQLPSFSKKNIARGVLKGGHG